MAFAEPLPEALGAPNDPETGGTLTVESVLKQGTTFTMELPA